MNKLPLSLPVDTGRDKYLKYKIPRFINPAHHKVNYVSTKNQLIPIERQVALSNAMSGKNIVTFCGNGTSANDTNGTNPTEEFKKIILHELQTSLGLIQCNLKTGNDPEAASKALVVKNCPELIFFLNNIGTKGVINLLNDYLKKYQLNLSAENIVRLQNILVNISEKTSLNCINDKHCNMSGNNLPSAVNTGILTTAQVVKSYQNVKSAGLSATKYQSKNQLHNPLSFTTNVKSELATESDLVQIHQIDLETFAGNYQIFEDFYTYKVDLDKHGITTHTLKTEDGKFIGYYQLEPVENGELYIYSIGVKKELRNTRKSYDAIKKMQEEISDFAHEQGVEKVVLDVAANNTNLVKLYKKLGFKITDEYEGFEAGNKYHDYRMEANVKNSTQISQKSDYKSIDSLNEYRLYDEEFASLKAEIKTKLDNLPQIAGKLKDTLLTKENITVLDRFISDEKLYNKKNLLKNLGLILSSINTPEQAVLANKLLSDERLYNNENLVENFGLILSYTKTPKQSQIKIDLMDKFLSDKKLYNNENLVARFCDILHSAITVKQAQIKIDLMDKFISDEKLHNNEDWIDNFFDILKNTKTSEQAQITNKFFSDESMYNNENLVYWFCNILSSARTTERAQITNKFLSDKKLFENEDLVDRFCDILHSINTPEQAQLTNMFLSDNKLYNNKHLLENFSHIINRVQIPEQARLVNMLLSNKRLYNNKGLINKFCGILDDTQTPEQAQMKIDLLDKFLSEKKLYNNKNWIKNFNSILSYTNTPEQLQLTNKFLTDKKLYNNKDLVDKFCTILHSINSPEQAQLKINLIDKLISDEKLCNNPGLLERFCTILHSINTPEQAQLKIDLVDKFISNEELYNNKHLIENFDYIVRCTQTPEQAQLVNMFWTNEKLYRNENLVKNFGTIMYFIENPKQAQVTNKLLSDEKLYNNKKLVEQFSNILYCINKSPQARLTNKLLSDEKLYNNEKLVEQFSNILCNINEPEQAQLISKLLSNEKLYNDENLIESFYNILSSTQDPQQVLVKIDLVDKFLSDKKLCNNENLVKTFYNILSVNLRKKVLSLIDIKKDVTQLSNIEAFLIANKELLKQPGMNELKDSQIKDLLSYSSINEAIYILEIGGEDVLKHAIELKYEKYKDFIRNAESFEYISTDLQQLLKEKIAKLTNPEQKLEKIKIITTIIGNIDEASLKDLIDLIKTPAMTPDQKAMANRIFSTKKSYNEQIEDFIIEFNVPVNKQDNVRKLLQKAVLNEKFFTPPSVNEQIAILNKKMQSVMQNNKIPQDKKTSYINTLKRQIINIKTKPEDYTRVSINDTGIKSLAQIVEAHINLPNYQKEFNAQLNNLIYQKAGIKTTSQLLNSIQYDNKYLSELICMSNYGFQAEFVNLIGLLKTHPDKKLTDIMLEIPENQETKALFEENGLDFNKWIKFDKNFNYPFTLNFEVESAVELIRKNLVKELNSELAKKLDPKEITKLKQILYDNNIKQAAQNKLPKIIKLIKKELNTNKYWQQNIPEIQTFKEHLKIYKKNINDIEKLTNTTEELNVRLWDNDDVGRNLFFGNHVGCCTSVGNSNSFAAPQHLMNSFVNGIEIVDKAGNSLGNSMCYFAKVDGELTFVIDSFEANGKLVAAPEVLNAVIEYAKQICKKMGRPDANIMFGSDYNKLNLERCIRTDNHKIEIIGKAPQLTYIDALGGISNINNIVKSRSMYEITNL